MSYVIEDLEVLSKENGLSPAFGARLESPAAVRSSERLLFQALIESAPLAMVMINSDGKIILVNAETEKQFGYSRNELLDQPIEILVPERFRADHPAKRNGFFDAPVARQMGAGRDLYGLRKDGSEFPVEIGLSPVQTDDEAFVLSTVVDISERKKLEDRFQALIESAPLAMVMINSDGKIILVNVEAEKQFGYSRNEMLDQPIEILVPERFRADHPAKRNGFFDAPAARQMGAGRDLYGLRKDGSEFPVEIGLSPVQTDDEAFVLSTVVDISERKKLEDRFRAAIESAPLAMVMINSDGKIVLANADANNQFGYESGELLSQPIEKLLPKRFRADHPQQRNQYFDSPSPRRMGSGRDLFGYRKDGSEFPVEIGINPVITDEGVFVLSAIVDISDRKQLEAHVQSSREALEESNVELKQFAYVASHDLQTPLRTVAGFAQLLNEDYADKLDEEGEELIERIVNGCKRMQTMIHDLLTYSRVESRSRSFEPIELRPLFDEVLDLLEADINETGGEVKCSDLPTVLGDRSQLSHLLLNLIGNGLKYHGESPPSISVSAEQSGSEWIISIKDNGIGIAAEHHDRIFEVFRRLHTQQKYPGTGIGLAVCRRIVVRHGGRIWLESSEGNGSTFHFTIPDADAANVKQ